MAWYHYNGMEDLVVPKHQEVDDYLPSPESWSTWDFTSPGNFNDECFAVDANSTRDKPKFNGRLCHDVGFESTADFNNPFTCSSIYGGLSSNQAPVSQHQTDHQLADFGRFEQLDDIFLGSLLEDPTWSEDLHKSFCFSPGYECETMAADYLLQDASPAKTLVPPEQITANGFVSEGMPLEESVLKELEMVMTQLSNKTRICFRDAFYRLAKNSTQNPVALDQHGNLRAQTHYPKWTISEEKTRLKLLAFYYHLRYFHVVPIFELLGHGSGKRKRLNPRPTPSIGPSQTSPSARWISTFQTFRFAKSDNSKQKFSNSVTGRLNSSQSRSQMTSNK